jgi:signal transduction histidine kinase
MQRLPVPIRSMRLWLQSTTLLAVVAGYSVLLLFNQRLANLQRSLLHEQLVTQVLNELRSRPLSHQELDRISRGLLAPGVRMSVVEEDRGHGTDRGATEQRDTWLSSAQTVFLTDGQRVRVQVEQDISDSIQQEWFGFWLLVAAAGVSSLFTGALLRLVLRRGLTQPLEVFSQQLQSIQTPPGPDDRIDLHAQPVEIRPIGAAFNDLQERLRTAWDQQRTFMDGVAHELRTPITLISGRTQSLMRRQDLQPIAPSLDLIRREADQMGTLVSDLLDLARRDAGHLNLRLESLVAEDVLLMAYERLAPRADGRLRIDSPDDTAEIRARADRERLQQCLTVLVDNALHYTPINETVSLACSASADGGMVLHVRDRGPGVAESERERIFERFVRGSIGLSSERRGSGLGLALVKLLMEAMGGTATVGENPGGGADFQLILPGVSVSDRPA